MPTNKELLVKAQALNNEEKYSEVIELLPDDLLEKLHDADLYAEKAQAYYRLKEKDLCEKAVDKALDINPNQAKANHYKGNIFYFKFKKTNEAIEYYNKAIECDPKFIYPYSGLGGVYGDLNEYDKAIENYNKALELDPKDAYSYNGLGSIYYVLKEYDKAIENYNKALKSDPKYVNAYNGLGLAYYKINEFNKAIENFNNAIKLNPKFDSPYYNRALVYRIRNEYQKAIDDYKQYIEFTKDKSDYFVLQAHSEIEELSKSVASADFGNIKQLVQRIKDVLLLKDNSVTHYTSITAAKAMILEESKFRLSECAFLNDSSEGRELFKFLGISEAPSRKSEENCAMPFTRKPFIGSFVPDTKHDDLTLWRMYGKENKEEAKGCSITIDSKKLQESIRDAIASKSKIDTNQIMGDDFSFYRMVYRTQDQGNPFVIPGLKDEEKELNIYMNQLAEKVKEYRANAKKESYSIKDLLELLNSIAYLFKSAEYRYEHEIRVVVNGVGLEKNIISDSTPPRVYIETVPINPIIQKITLGPKVERVDEWAAAFYYKLDKQGYHPDIYISHLPFK